MTVKMTVIIHAGGQWRRLARLMDSLDAQSLPYDTFELIFVLEDAASEVGRRLAGLSQRRPNARIREISNGDDDPTALVQQSTGAWLLYLGRGALDKEVRLAAQALERLYEFAATNDCDLVVGRYEYSAGRFANDLFVEDVERFDDLSPSALLDSPVVVYRRGFAVTYGTARDHASADTVVAAADRIGLLAAYPCAVIAGEKTPEAHSSLKLTDSAAAWRAGRVVVSVRGSIRQVPTDGRVRFSIRHLGSGVDYWLPSDGDVSGDGEFSGSTEVDVCAAALGERLSDGVWQLAVGIHGSDPVWGEHAPVLATAVSAGIVNGILVAPSAVDGSFALDVGATRSSVIPKLDPQDITIEESAAGTFLTAHLDDLSVHGESTIPGYLLLDKFRLRAALVAADQHARLECFLSSLAGTASISTKFGTGPPAPIGLSLAISPLGIMTVVSAASGRPGTARGVSKVHASGRPADVPVIVRLRHRMPSWLDPLVQALARNKLAGRTYRRLAGKS